MSSVVWYKHKNHVKSVKISKREEFKVFNMVRFIFNLKHGGRTSVSVQKKGVQVRIWQIPLRQPSRQGPLNQPGRAQCLPQSPCQPIHLKESKATSAFSLYRHQLCDPPLLCCYSDRLLPFFKALSMSFSRSRACLFPGSFLRRVRMYFRAFSYSCGKKNTRHEMRET